MSRRPAELVRTMLRIQRDRLTGALGVRVDDIVTTIYFDAGHPVYAAGGMVNDTLGRMLLAEGRIDEQDYDAAIDRMSRSTTLSSSDQDMRLGELLVVMGKLSVEDVREALGRQVQCKIERSISVSETQLSFNALDALPETLGRFPCAVEPRVLASARRYFSRRRAADYLRPLSDTFLTLDSDADSVADRFNANESERAVIASINGARTTKDLIERQLRKEVEPHAVLTALVLAAAVKATREPSARIRASASRPVLRSRSSAPRIRARSSHPQIVESEPPARISGVDFSAATISEIPAPASQPRPKPVASASKRKQLSRLQAEQAFQRGLRRLRSEDLDRAAELLAQAAEALPSSLEYQLYARWADYRATSDAVQLASLEPLAKLLAKQDRAHGLPPYVLAHLALEQGNDDKALKLFKMAVRRDPKNAAAKRELERLTARISKKA